MKLLERFLGFFKKTEQVAEPIKDRVLMALLLGNRARNIFSDALDQLKEANKKLDEAQKEAEAIIKQHQNIVDATNMHKINNLTTITNLEKLISIDNKIQNGGKE